MVGPKAEFCHCTLWSDQWPETTCAKWFRVYWLAVHTDVETDGTTEVMIIREIQRAWSPCPSLYVVSAVYPHHWTPPPPTHTHTHGNNIEYIAPDLRGNEQLLNKYIILQIKKIRKLWFLYVLYKSTLRMFHIWLIFSVIVFISSISLFLLWSSV